MSPLFFPSSWSNCTSHISSGIKKLQLPTNPLSLFFKTLLAPLEGTKTAALTQIKQKPLFVIAGEFSKNFLLIGINYFNSIGKPPDPHEHVEHFFDAYPYFEKFDSFLTLILSTLEKIDSTGKSETAPAPPYASPLFRFPFFVKQVTGKLFSTASKIGRVAQQLLFAFQETASRPTPSLSEPLLSADHKGPLKPTQAALLPADLAASIEQEKRKFAETIGRFVPIKLMEELFELPRLDDQYYNALLTKNSSDEALKRAFFSRFDEMFFLVRWIAKLVYYFIAPFTKSLFNNFTRSILKAAQHHIVESDRKNLEKLIENNLEDSNEFLAHLVEAYKKISPNSSLEEIDLLLHQKLSEPWANHGYTSKDIRDLAVATAIRSYLPSIALLSKIRKTLHGLQISENSPLAFLNFPIKLMTYSFSALLGALLWIPEWLINYLLRFTLKKVGNNMDIINVIFNKSTDFIQHENGLSYSALKILNKCFEEVLVKLQSPKDRAETTEHLNISNDLMQKQVELLFEATYLAKSRRDSIQPSKTSTLFNQLDLFFSQQTALGLKKAMLTVFQTLTKKGYLEEKTYRLMTLINESFIPNHDNPQEVERKRKEEEKKFQENLEKILSIAIHREITASLESYGLSNLPNFLHGLKQRGSNYVLKHIQEKVKESVELVSKRFFLQGLMHQFLTRFLKE